MTTQELADGAIISWVAPDKPVQLSDLRRALVRAGLPEELAKDMAPRNAFTRAARELSKERIIKKVEEDDDEIKFQFTREFLLDGEYDYRKEFDLYLNKDNGTVRCDDANMQRVAQQLVDNHKVTRLPADITRLIQKIFESKAGDLIPIRQQGGCYFVPSVQLHLLSNIRTLLSENQGINGKLNEWEITAKSEQTQVTIQQNMYEYMLGLVDEYNKSCESITENTSEKVLERRLERVRELKQKLVTHAPLLQGLAAEVSNAIKSAEHGLISAAMGQPVTQPAPPQAELAEAC